MDFVHLTWPETAKLGWCRHTDSHRGPIFPVHIKSRFLRRFTPNLARTLPYLKNELDPTSNVLRTGFRVLSPHPPWTGVLYIPLGEPRAPRAVCHIVFETLPAAWWCKLGNCTLNCHFYLLPHMCVLSPLYTSNVPIQRFDNYATGKEGERLSFHWPDSSTLVVRRVLFSVETRPTKGLAVQCALGKDTRAATCVCECALRACIDISGESQLQTYGFLTCPITTVWKKTSAWFNRITYNFFRLIVGAAKNFSQSTVVHITKANKSQRWLPICGGW